MEPEERSAPWTLRISAFTLSQTSMARTLMAAIFREALFQSLTWQMDLLEGSCPSSSDARDQMVSA